MGSPAKEADYMAAAAAAADKILAKREDTSRSSLRGSGRFSFASALHSSIRKSRISMSSAVLDMKPCIKVTFPVSGTNVNAEESLTVLWRSTGGPGTHVKVLVLF